ncbi:hypothetical protein V6N13_126795 [Hibiscus sabdariffa]
MELKIGGDWVVSDDTGRFKTLNRRRRVEHDGRKRNSCGRSLEVVAGTEAVFYGDRTGAGERQNEIGAWRFQIYDGGFHGGWVESSSPVLKNSTEFINLAKPAFLLLAF